MDAFYASVEQRDNPNLRGKPLVVGGDPDSRGVVAAASYEARKFGIRSAIPCSRAQRLCPSAIFVPPRMSRYKEVSRQIHRIFADYTDLIEPLSLDEAYLDVTADKAGLGSATATAEAIRTRIRDELQLTASAGVAPIKFVAKIASDFNKPDGQTVVPPHRVLAFIRPLPIRKLWGVGPATAEQIEALGVTTIGDLAAIPESKLLARLGKRGPFLSRLARGIDARSVSPNRERKSQGAERTFAEDVLDRSRLEEVLEGQAERVCERISQQGIRARTVTLKIRYADFTTLTRSETLSIPTADAAQTVDAAKRLLDKTEAGERPVRLIGVSLSNLVRPGGSTVKGQLELPF